ncbi:MAG: 16S rRNA (uracil(1498)-N(3))-methyltransferase [Candidatus Dactylopiibacterium carminicum]|uniref:Ribosomal RNA small subunit methyltransferase E n=1 Tax=Candidatus Dactylopiibacterium carminicum TaxID=857335 RepID=A0A272ES82_9RHOO|nr:16S rRNA (uracil(1498)-N(3))-methyltransferase [Candidatus Dactylopiibacterium carminicum]KAF7598978.1 16S rRNA (uracil(1498)-N(3))-methyltransferase [Candidatus Dactylopiibacterium carminicum]PAS92955.1 MAG: 16S rRNA (uracil(1498)-N(3))-methyltransferase [Candidatus Dactylopiibacterium carminicum]PAS96605.1 MAG: 16S rRNA (uracil(1498)-N(3))-methyltransferase [Candidatus Dactylopiibacterium carminicum]PAS98991.1 MAG: 16S rRNA (uracil(1498)-N(3))-methyltransferase [Candidatus Dactylopiibacter
MPPRFHCPLPLVVGQTLPLPAEVAHHAIRVLRMRPGEALALFDGQGHECLGELTEVDGTPAARLTEAVPDTREAPLAITLVQALAVADKMDWIVQKAVELGAVAVQPVEAERCVLKLAGDRVGKRVAHWQQIAVGAAEQCGRNRLCRVENPQSLSRWLQTPFNGERWILAPGEGVALSGMQPPQGPVALLIGPEGGWSEVELAKAGAAGCRPVSLGPRVLRTETAGLAALAAMMALWGDY